MNIRDCVFCDREVESMKINGYSCQLHICPQCGEYGITDDLLSDIKLINNVELIRISHLLAEKRLEKSGRFMIAEGEHGEIINFQWISYRKLLNKYPSEPLEILDRVLINISRIISSPSKNIMVKEDMKEIFFASDAEDINYILRQFNNQKYISEFHSIPQSFTIEANGWKKIGELKKKPSGTYKQVFVAMWFDKSMNVIFEDGIKKAIKDSTGFNAQRVDLVQHNNKICDQIIAEINKSKFMIADFTGSRGGVYFEAGYAQGIGLPVIWLVNENEVNNLHFDTRQYNHIVYSNEHDLYSKLKARIEATIIETA